MPIAEEVRQAARDTMAGLKVDYLDLYLLPADHHRKALKVQHASQLVVYSVSGRHRVTGLLNLQLFWNLAPASLRLSHEQIHMLLD